MKNIFTQCFGKGDRLGKHMEEYNIFPIVLNDHTDTFTYDYGLLRGNIRTQLENTRNYYSSRFFVPPDESIRKFSMITSFLLPFYNDLISRQSYSREMIRKEFHGIIMDGWRWSRSDYLFIVHTLEIIEEIKKTVSINESGDEIIIVDKPKLGRRIIIIKKIRIIINNANFYL